MGWEAGQNTVEMGRDAEGEQRGLRRVTGGGRIANVPQASRPELVLAARHRQNSQARRLQYVADDGLSCARTVGGKKRG
ncbi:hypothetical protein LBMAG56_15320 [Verrucomicrobiota bacterium]|nr:hypothetical protein LBMAG56_15320 [Verrucomicrobiota bacterium]